MLASLLLNLGQAGTVLFDTGARLTLLPHAPEVTVEYESEQWVSPQGRAPNRTLEILLDRPATALVVRRKPEPAKSRTVQVDAEWHAQAEFVRGALLQVKHWSFDTATGQAIEFDLGASVALTPHQAAAIESWAATVKLQSRPLPAARPKQVRATAGATATFSTADVNQIICNVPDVTGIRNPSPAEILAMVHAARKSRIVRQFDNKKI